jgi:hypothetical protein
MPEIANVVSGNTITSTWGNQIRDRTIQRYASATARATAHPSPTAGDLSYLTDVDDIALYDGANWIPLRLDVEMGGNVSSTLINLNTAPYVEIVAVTFTKPAHWNTFKIMVWGGATIRANPTDSWNVDTRIVIGASQGTAVTTNPQSTSGANETWHAAARHEVAGLAATVAVALQGKTSDAPTETSQVGGAVINYLAVRTT